MKKKRSENFVSFLNKMKQNKERKTADVDEDKQVELTDVFVLNEL